MIRLGVNIDHVATVRNARGETYPDPVQAAVMAELGGADNITCHLREDRRHIKDRDVDLLRATIQIPLNFEMAATDEMVAIACRIKPHAVTLVPERRQELTTEGGLDVSGHQKSLGEKTKRLKDAGILISYFVSTDPAVIELSAKLGADALEFHTGDLCHGIDTAATTKEKGALLTPFIRGAELCRNAGMQVHCGHGLHYGNTQWLQHVPHLEEANIGHAIVARALFVGLKEAVAEMKVLLNDPTKKPYFTP